MEREFSEYGKAEYERISKLSVAHIDRLRGSRVYRNVRVNEAHETLNGAATKKVMEREFSEYGKAEYERISSYRWPIFTACAGAGFTRTGGSTSPRQNQRR